MTKVWLNKQLKSEEKVGIIMVINLLVLIIVMAVASTERPLFLYKKAEGEITQISVEYVSYHIKTTISFYSTVIHYKDFKKTDKLILGYILNGYDLTSAKQVKAKYYTVKGIKKTKQLFIDSHMIISYNQKIGITVWIVSIISLILEAFIVRHYMRNWTFRMKSKRNK